MIFALSIIGIFVVTSIYFYFRAETLQRDLMIAKKEISNMAKEHKSMISSMVTVSSSFEEFSKQRFNQIKRIMESSGQNEEILQQLELISPFIHNYAVIYRECAKGSGRLKTITQKCYESYDESAYKKFVGYVNSQDKKIKNMWAGNNLSGFIALVESLLRLQEETILKGMAVGKPLPKVS